MHGTPQLVELVVIALFSKPKSGGHSCVRATAGANLAQRQKGLPGVEVLVRFFAISKIRVFDFWQRLQDLLERVFLCCTHRKPLFFRLGQVERVALVAHILLRVLFRLPHRNFSRLQKLGAS